jgi:hypothetical protein
MWCQVVYTMTSQCRKLKYDTLNFVKIDFQNFVLFKRARGKRYNFLGSDFEFNSFL